MKHEFILPKYKPTYCKINSKKLQSPFVHPQVATTLQLYTLLSTTSAVSALAWRLVSSAWRPNTLWTNGIADAPCTATNPAAACIDGPFAGRYVGTGRRRAPGSRRLRVKRKVWERAMVVVMSSSRRRAAPRLCSRRARRQEIGTNHRQRLQHQTVTSQR